MNKMTTKDEKKGDAETKETINSERKLKQWKRRKKAKMRSQTI